MAGGSAVYQAARVPLRDVRTGTGSRAHAVAIFVLEPDRRGCALSWRLVDLRTPPGWRRSPDSAGRRQARAPVRNRLRKSKGSANCARPAVDAGAGKTLKSQVASHSRKHSRLVT